MTQTVTAHLSLATRIAARDIHYRLVDLGLTPAGQSPVAWNQTRDLTLDALVQAASSEDAASRIVHALQSHCLLAAGADTPSLTALVLGVLAEQQPAQSPECEARIVVPEDAYERGLHAARRGIQPLLNHPDCDLEGSPEGLDELEAFARIEFVTDPGEPGTGSAGWSGWVLSDRQEDTGLALLLHRYAAMHAALLELLGQFDQAHDALGVARSPSAQMAIANATALVRPPPPSFSGA